MRRQQEGGSSILKLYIVGETLGLCMDFSHHRELLSAEGRPAEKEVPAWKSTAVPYIAALACWKEEGDKSCASRQESSWDPLACRSDPQNECQEGYGLFVGLRPLGEGGPWLFFQYLPIRSTNWTSGAVWVFSFLMAVMDWPSVAEWPFCSSLDSCGGFEKHDWIRPLGNAFTKALYAHSESSWITAVCR